MIENDTIYYSAVAEGNELNAAPELAFDFEALGEALVRTDSVMYREVPSDSVATAEATAIYGGLSQTVAPRLHDRSATNSPFTSSVAFNASILS